MHEVPSRVLDNPCAKAETAITSQPRLGAKDPRLNDPRWLTSRYNQHGDMWIALELGCSRVTVRNARQRHGIPSHPRGPRRGSTITAVPPEQPTPIAQLTTRFTTEARAGGPAPTEDLLVTRLRSAHQARLEGDQDAYDDALVSIASAALLIHHHRQQHRQAA